MSRYTKKLFYFFISSMLLITSIFSSAFVVSAAEIVYYDENFIPQNISSIPDDAFSIKVVPSKTSVQEGEQFYVDYIIKNNPGFSAFSVKVLYNSETVNIIDSNPSINDCEVTHGVRNLAVIMNKFLNANIARAKDSGFKNYFLMANILTSQGNVSEANNNGILFRVNYEAVKSGNCNFALNGIKGVMFGDKNSKTIPIYVENSSINIY